MALYLVRWPDLSCTLVTAHDENHLVYVLDEVGNAEGCRWTEYDGPVFIDFQLPVRTTIDWPEQAGMPLPPDAVQVEELDLLAQREGIPVELSIYERPTDELLAERAAKYGLSVEDYRRRNLLRTDVTSADVAALAVAMCGPAFRATTGAQVSVDGGNERVI